MSDSGIGDLTGSTTASEGNRSTDRLSEDMALLDLAVGAASPVPAAGSKRHGGILSKKCLQPRAAETLECPRSANIPVKIRQPDSRKTSFDASPSRKSVGFTRGRTPPKTSSSESDSISDLGITGGTRKKVTIGEGKAKGKSTPTSEDKNSMRDDFDPVDGPLVSNSTSRKKSVSNSSGKNDSPHMQKENSNTFDSYVELWKVQQGLKRGELIEGVLRINPKNYEDAYICAPDGQMDIYIGGVRDRNRALNGDVVVVQLNPPSKWKVLRDKVHDYLDNCGTEEDFSLLLHGIKVSQTENANTEYEETKTEKDRNMVEDFMHAENEIPQTEPLIKETSDIDKADEKRSIFQLVKNKVEDKEQADEKCLDVIPPKCNESNNQLDTAEIEVTIEIGHWQEPDTIEIIRFPDLRTSEITGCKNAAKYALDNKEICGHVENAENIAPSEIAETESATDPKAKKKRRGKRSKKKKQKKMKSEVVAPPELESIPLNKFGMQCVEVLTTDSEEPSEHSEAVNHSVISTAAEYSLQQGGKEKDSEMKKTEELNTGAHKIEEPKLNMWEQPLPFTSIIVSPEELVLLDQGQPYEHTNSDVSFTEGEAVAPHELSELEQSDNESVVSMTYDIEQVIEDKAFYEAQQQPPPSHSSFASADMQQAAGGGAPAGEETCSVSAEHFHTQCWNSSSQSTDSATRFSEVSFMKLSDHELEVGKRTNGSDILNKQYELLNFTSFSQCDNLNSEIPSDNLQSCTITDITATEPEINQHSIPSHLSVSAAESYQSANCSDDNINETYNVCSDNIGDTTIFSHNQGNDTGNIKLNTTCECDDSVRTDETEISKSASADVLKVKKQQQKKKKKQHRRNIDEANNNAPLSEMSETTTAQSKVNISQPVEAETPEITKMSQKKEGKKWDKRNSSGKRNAAVCEEKPQQNKKVNRQKNKEPEFDINSVLQHPLWTKFIQQTGKVVFITELKHSRCTAGLLKLMPAMKPVCALFSPSDHRVPRMKIPLQECPPDFIVRPADYATTLFIARISCWCEVGFAVGALCRSLGEAAEIEPQTEGMLLEYGIDYSEFDDSLLQSLPQLPWTIPAEEIKNRKDFRDVCVFTIDPMTARDLDDAVSCQHLGNGIYEVGVHIADVTYFLQEGMPLDHVAASRATSVYLVQKVVPMLPRVLCEYLCSLNPNEDRLTISVQWLMTEEGVILEEWFGRSVIRSCAKLSYEHAQEMIEFPSKVWSLEELPPISGAFTAATISEKVNQLQWIAVNLRAKRFSDGALRLDQPKLVFALDKETGLPKGFSIYEHKDSNKLIEEFMLLANMAVAKKLHHHFPDIAVLRCHPSPKEKMMEDIMEILSTFGIHIDISSSGTLQESLARYMQPDIYSQARSLILTNLLSQPMHTAKYFCAGFISDLSDYSHYALNVPLYTHFTSPIRRYCDVLVHRLLTAALRYTDVPKWHPLMVQRQAEHCNDKKTAAKAIQEQSAKMFLAVFVRECGPVEEQAVVLKVLDHSFDVIVLKMGIVKRVYTNKLPLKSKQYERVQGIPQLTLIWDADEDNPMMTKQVITIFSLVTVILQKSAALLDFSAVISRPPSSTVAP